MTKFSKLISENDDYETYIHIQPVDYPSNNIYVSFTTVFRRANNPTESQTKFGFVVKNLDELQNLGYFFDQYGKYVDWKDKH